MEAINKEMYTVANEGVLTFYYDSNKSLRKGTGIPYSYNGNDYLSPNREYNIKTVIFDESFKDARPLSCENWFSGFISLTKIEGIANLNTSEVTDMYRMFNGCHALANLDLSNFDTSNVNDMGEMFSECYELQNLDLSNFNTSNVRDMSKMFASCHALVNLD